MRIYLDNSATTFVCDEAAEAALEMMKITYGNPSSMHLIGLEAEHALKEARCYTASTLKAKDKELFFTSGGTESNNWAIFGAARAAKRKGMHIITGMSEHPSVLEPFKVLESEGWTVTRLAPDADGYVTPEALEEAITPETTLVSLMAVNNEIGVVQDIEGFGRVIKKKDPSILFHVDAVQAYGRYRIDPAALGIDLLSASGHKIHAPKGIGILYISEKARILPFIYGGGQQRKMRSGTDNVPGAAAFAAAAKKAYDNLEADTAKLNKLKAGLIEGLLQIENTVLNSPADEKGAPHIVNVSFRDVGSEVMLHALEEKGIFVSAGSACSSHSRQGSATLKAMGKRASVVGSAVRFSMCAENTGEEIEYVIQAAKELVPVLKRFKRR